MKMIPLRNSDFTLVDDEDFEWLNQGLWWLEVGPQGNRYACGKHLGKYVRMHNIIKPPSPGTINDHRDGNGLNNQKSNLRPCTQSQNCMNRSRANNKFGFKGVYVDRRYKSKPFGVKLGQRGARKYLGQFATPKLAAEAYNAAALKQYGEFANLNRI